MDKVKIYNSYFFWFGSTKQFPKFSFYDKRFDTEKQYWLAAADIEENGVIFFDSSEEYKIFKKYKFKTALKRIIDNFDTDGITKDDLVELLNACYEGRKNSYKSKNSFISDDVDIDDKMSKHKNIFYCMYSSRYNHDELFYDVIKKKVMFKKREIDLDDIHFGDIGRANRNYSLLVIYNSNI